MITLTLTATLALTLTLTLTLTRPVRGFRHLDETQKRALLDAGLLPAHILQLWLGELLPAAAP